MTALAAPTAAQEATESPPAVDLDKLLKLPSSHSVTAETERYGGATKSEWRARFQRAHEDVAQARASLSKSQEALKEVASDTSAWKVAAPGGGPSDMSENPLDYRLSQQIRRDREEVERSERHLRELQIEAELAGVPEAWQVTDSEEVPE